MRSQYVLSISLLAALLAGCGTPAEKRAPAAAPIAVQTVLVSETEWPDSYEAPGTVRARDTAVIASKVMGYIRQLSVQAGDTVRAGQLLVTLDARDLDAQQRQASAAVDEARGAGPEVESAVAQAKANLDLAGKTFARMQELYQKKSISEQEFDEAQARLRVARAAHQMAVSRRKQLQAKISQAEQASVGARVMQSYSRLTAPFAGVVVEKRMDAGSLASPGMPLLVIERAGAWRLEAQIEESRLAQVRAGSPVTVRLDALGREFAARVTEVVPSVDPASRGFIVKINLPSVAGLRSGLFGHAVFQGAAHRALAVPAAAVAEDGQISSVLVAENHVARARMLTLGPAHGELREVLSGLSLGERVIMPRPAGLHDGAPVEVRP